METLEQIERSKKIVAHCSKRRAIQELYHLWATIVKEDGESPVLKEIIEIRSRHWTRRGALREIESLLNVVVAQNNSVEKKMQRFIREFYAATERQELMLRTVWSAIRDELRFGPDGIQEKNGQLFGKIRGRRGLTITNEAAAAFEGDKDATR